MVYWEKIWNGMGETYLTSNTISQGTCSPGLYLKAGPTELEAELLTSIPQKVFYPFFHHFEEDWMNVL
jgi:hypothetical protein